MTASAGAMSPAKRMLLGAGIGLLFGVLILGKALQPGFVLFYDMVFVPDLALNSHTLGVDGSVPRAVPNDMFVSVVSLVLPGMLVQKILLLGLFPVLGAGIGRLLAHPAAIMVATAAACWNPYLGARLGIGHWGYLLGYAVLPWLLAGLVQARKTRSFRPLLWPSMAIAASGSTMAVTASFLIIYVIFWTPRVFSARQIGIAASWWLAINASWWWPFLLLAPTEHPDPAGVQAFAAKADTPLGLLPSLLSGGGIWNQGIWAPERQVLAMAVVGTALWVTGVVAWLVLARKDSRLRMVSTALFAASALGLLIAFVSRVSWGSDVITWIVVHIPGGGILRDSQKFLALWILLASLGWGLLAGYLNQKYAPKQVLSLATMVFVCAPIATFPSLAWGQHGKWQAQPYPEDFQTVATRVNSSPPGAVAVMPWRLYRRYEWNSSLITLDPWQRLIDRRVVVNDDLPLAALQVRGEDPVAAQIRETLAQKKPVVPVLRAAGIRYVIDHRDQPTITAEQFSAPGLKPVFSSANLQLFDLGPVPSPHLSPPWWAYGGLFAAAIASISGIIWWLGDEKARNVKNNRKFVRH